MILFVNFEDMRARFNHKFEVLREFIDAAADSGRSLGALSCI